MAKGLVDAAAVDGHQWEYFERFSPALHIQDTRYPQIAALRQPPTGGVRSPAGRIENRKFKQVILSMHTDPVAKPFSKSSWSIGSSLPKINGMNRCAT